MDSATMDLLPAVDTHDSPEKDVVLPVSVWGRIASWLTADEMARCECVSRSWHKVFAHEPMWKEVCVASVRVNFKRSTRTLVMLTFVWYHCRKGTHRRLPAMRK